MFIYLALYFHEVVKYIFSTLSNEQFNLIDNIQNEFGLSFIIAMFKVVLGFLVPIATTIIMWTLILHGADYVFRMLGLENKAGNILDNLFAKVDKFANPIQ